MRALIVVGAGVEDLETIVIFDILRRAKFDANIASISGDDIIRLSMGTFLKPHKKLIDCKDIMYDIIAFPGGPGCFAVADDPVAQEMCKKHLEAGKIVGAVCAAPAALSKHGFFKGKRTTCYPSAVDLMSEECIFEDKRVVIDGNLITGKGPGTTIEFALALVEAYTGEAICENVRKELRLDDLP